MLSVEAMNKGIKKHNVKFLEFTRIHANKPNCLICFFEGEDARYYQIRIQENLHGGIELESIDCKGKKPVLELFELLETHSELKYRRAKTAFFVDRDFDPPLPPDKRTKIYEVAFFSKFLTKLKEELCVDKSQHFDKKRKIHFAIPTKTSDILSQFSQYADTPQCLRNYLKQLSIVDA